MSGAVKPIFHFVIFLTVYPVLIGSVMRAFAQATDYGALVRSVFFVFGLAVMALWLLRRKSLKQGLLGLGYVLSGYIAFIHLLNVTLSALGANNSLDAPLPTHLPSGLREPFAVDVPWGYVMAIILLISNVVMMSRRMTIRRIVFNNTMIVLVILVVAATLTAW